MIVGTMASDSLLRRQQWLEQGCNMYDSKRPLSKPMSFWKRQDVLSYIKQFGLDFCPVYGEIKEDEHGMLYTTGAQRTGCMFCCFGVHREKEPNRFQQMKLTHPKEYDYCMRPKEEHGLGLDEVLTYMKIPH